MKQRMNLAASLWVDASDTAREMRSGLPGLGGRPTMHPAWSGQSFGANAGMTENEAQSSRDEFSQRHQRTIKGN